SWHPHGIEGLHEAFSQQLIQSFSERFEFCRRWIVKIRKYFRRKSWNLVIDDGRIFGERIANFQIRIPYETQNISWIRFFHNLPFLAGQFVHVRELDFFSSSCVGNQHVPGVAARAQAEKSHTISVAWIHVPLNLKDEARKHRLVGFYQARVSVP